MKQTVTISQNMGCNPTIIKTPSIMFPANNRRPTFDNQLIKKKEFKSINTVNSYGRAGSGLPWFDPKRPDMSRTPIQIPLKDHVKASYSNGDLKKMTFIGKDDIVNTFYTPPIQIKQNIKSIAGLSSVDTGLLSGLSDMGSDVAKGVAMLTMQNILKIDNDGKTPLNSVFTPDKQQKAELALQNYKSRQSSIASSRGWSADEISKKNKESIDLYIGEIEPLINSADEKKAFNEILLSSSSSMTQKLMPFDPSLLAPPTGSSMTQLTTALTTLNATIVAGGVPVGGVPVGGVPVGGAPAIVPPVVLKQRLIDQKEINNTVRAMLVDSTGNNKDNRVLTVDDLRKILNDRKLNTAPEFKQFFQTNKPTVIKKTLTKSALTTAMANYKVTADILENIAYGILTQNQSASKSWTQFKAGTNHKDIYDARILAGNGRKRNKKTQNKAHVNLSEISKILKKYQ